MRAGPPPERAAGGRAAGGSAIRAAAVADAGWTRSARRRIVWHG